MANVPIVGAEPTRWAPHAEGQEGGRVRPWRGSVRRQRMAWTHIFRVGLLLVLTACTHRPSPSLASGVLARSRIEPAPEFGGPLHVTLSGPHDGRPLVLIHGVGEAGARDFDPIVPALSERYRLLAFDLPGFARSTRHEDVYSPARYVAMASALIARHFGDRAVLVLGHSMGGALAIELAADHPVQVERLMVLDVAGILHYREYLREVIEGSPRTPWQATLSQARQTLFAVGMFPARRMKLEDLALEANPVLRSFFSSSRSAALRFITHDFGPALRRVRAPTLVGWGAHDTVAPKRTAMILRSQLPVERYVEFADSGHVPMRTEPAAVVQAVVSFVDASAPVHAEQPFVPAREGTCERRRDRLFSGDYDTVTIHRCKGVVLRHVRARQVVIDRSEVVLEDVALESLATAATFRRSRVRWSGGKIVAPTCIRTDGSAIDLGGVQCDFRERSIEVLKPTRIRASVSVLRHRDETRLHGEYDLFRTQPGALAELRASAVRGSQHSRSTLSSQDMAGEWLVGEDLRGASLVGADLSEARLDRARLDGADLRGARIVDAHLSDAVLRDADLSGARLGGSDLRRADLRGADLREATLDDARLSDARYDARTRFPDGFSPGAHGMLGEERTP